MIWTAFLLVQVVLLYFLLTQRSRCESDPPLDKGAIPWLGHAIEFGKDAAKFLTRMKEKHGDIFTVLVVGRYVTVLLDPHSYDCVISDSDSLDFQRYADVLMERIFKLRLPHRQPAHTKALMKQHFLGMNLSALNDTMSRHLEAMLKAEIPLNQKYWKQKELFDFSYSLLFKAGYLTLFGGEQNNNSSNPSSVYDEYRKFDNLLTKLARKTLKPEEKKTAQNARHRLWELLAPLGQTADSGSSAWIHAYRRLLQEEGADEEMQRRAILLQLWATQGNVGPAAFWLLGFLLTNPEALTAVRNEFKQISQIETSGASLLHSRGNTPVFDSALEETLRLTAAPFITREVVQEKTIQMANGQEYHLRKGDRVCLFPFTSPQMDPEIYPDPQKFQFDRFLNKDGTTKRDFYKGGRRLKYYTMPWGAGTNGCVGKQFAINTIRQFAYLMLNMDLELCDTNAQMPEINTSRYGFGMLQPKGDLLVHIKARKVH
ncbi:prostacyclin synthase-like [Corythoichthys intestinalis]|uniref:prostacyclin synthase-like n=1 Tax=Corythoichthys intestinalis TaxID=161448 RepID=UPI0025A4CDB6|nr:prostacyclin synthase-like [Corythoichthys intestinalis]XP_061813856.1 prostacyclin synthase-like [Nerophis lumbriciformis]